MELFILKKKACLFLFVFIVLTLFPSYHLLADEEQRSIQGELKVESEQNMVSLDGEWEFYWGGLFTPHDFSQSQLTGEYVEVPMSWTKYDSNYPSEGYGTYRLTILFPENEIGNVKALYMPSVSSSYRLWIDGIEKASNGTVGTTKDTVNPDTNSKVIPFEVTNSSMEVVIQVANFNQRKAGLVNKMYVGEPDAVFQYAQNKLLARAIIVVTLFIIGLYHLVFYLFRRKNKSFLFFGFVAMFISIRAALLEEELASYLVSFFGWELAAKIEYLGAICGLLFFTLFTYTQYEKEMSKILRNVIVGVTSLVSIFIIFTPAIIHTKTLNLLLIMIVIAFVYLIYVYVLAFLHKREGSVINVVAILLFFLSVLNDVLYYSGFIQTTELASFGLLFFLITQSINLSRSYAKSVEKSELLAKDLVKLNASLEQQVRRRTEQLMDTNKELQLLNEHLQDVHLYQSKWIRNISHELSTPLTSILSYTKGMLDGIIQKENKYLQLIHEQGLFVAKLLNDLNDITEIESGTIKFNMEKVNIEEYVRLIFEKYKVDMEKQEIHLNYQGFEDKKGRYVLMDVLRMEQVFVNLLKNAQRFVPKGKGEISIQLEERDKKVIRILVKDNGIGIKESEKSLIFNRFYKNSNRGKSYNGSGLGLAISKEIMEYHKGTITVESEEGLGSCFILTLPLWKD